MERERCSPFLTPQPVWVYQFAAYRAIKEGSEIDTHFLEARPMRLQRHLIRVLFVEHEHARILRRSMENGSVITCRRANFRHRRTHDWLLSL
jgi:hypothetical protein